MWKSVFLSLLFSTLAIAASPQLRPGDVLLISLHCPICQTIEAEEKGPYSHAGVVSVNPKGEVSVLEAITNPVGSVSLQKFLSRKREGTSVLVLRAKNALIPERALLKRFNEHFLNHSYDEQFLWDDRDEKGEKFYCSELVAKLLDPFLPSPIPTKPMHYTVDLNAWIEFFHGANPPNHLPGISPVDLSRSSLFDHVGELN